MEAAPLTADDTWRSFIASGMPAHDDELWKYSRVFDLDLGALKPVTAAPPAVVPPELDAIDFTVGGHAAIALVRDGHVVNIDVSDAAQRAGLRVEIGPPSAGGAAAPVPRSEPFAALNAELTPGALTITVPDGVVIEAPVVVQQWTSAPGGACFPRTEVRAGSGSQVTVVEYVGSEGVPAVTVPLVELVAADAAVVRYLGVQNLDPATSQIAFHRATVGRQATVSSSDVALGGDYARLRLDVDLNDEGGTAELVAAYFSDGRQQHDFRTLQDHRGRRTTSDLLFKGVVTDLAHSIYTGLIRVHDGAEQTSAFLTNRNIVLSEGARAYSVPNLEIINENDLRNCGHASASGPIDDDQLFYLESRGVPRDSAERLIVLGFFDDVFQRMPVPSLLTRLRRTVADKFDRSTS